MLFPVMLMNYNGGSSSGGQFISITGNNIHDVGRYCTTTTTGRDGIFISNDNVTIEGNQIHDIGRGAPGEILSGVTCVDSVNTLHYQSNDHGIYVDGAFTSANNLTVKNNIFYRNERGWSIQVYPASVSNLRILNNTFLCPNPYSIGHIVLNVPALTNSLIANNISWQPKTSFLYYYNTSGYSSVSVSNNLTYQGTVGNASAPSGVTSSGNLDNNNPNMVSTLNCTVDDPSVPNAYLQVGSPAMDAGLTLSDVPIDYAGTPRPPGPAYDIGAYEFIPGAASSPCDVNGDGVTNVSDVQIEVNMALGIGSCTNPSGICNVTSVQRVVNAALGGSCLVGP